MLPKKNRLNKKEDFQKTLKKGSMKQGVFFGAAFYKTKEKSEPKVGFIVSNKISKKAVERNRIKRILRAAVSGRIESLPEGMLLVFLAKKSAAGKDSSELREDVEKLLEKVL